MKDVHFYYFRNENRTPIITVCLLNKEDQVARGIAICAPKDNFSKSMGRMFARNRAIKALLTKKTSDPVFRDEAIYNIDSEFDLVHYYNDDIDSVTEFKSMFNPVLTDFEKRLLRK